jgi:hypothetical protein
MMDGSISYDPQARLEPVLSGATVKQGDKIARVFDAPVGTMLTRADEPGDEFFLILDGTASVDVATETRGPLRPGAFFGEMSLLDGGPRSATIVAETPVRLLVISRRNFSVLLQRGARAHPIPLGDALTAGPAGRRACGAYGGRVGWVIRRGRHPTYAPGATKAVDVRLGT